MGVARMPSQGAGRPGVITSTGSPLTFTDRPGRRKLDVGFSAMLATISLPRRNTAQYATRMIAQEALRGHLVAKLGAFRLDARKTVADLHPFDGVDAHQGIGQLGVEAIENRLTPARRHAGRNDVDACPDGLPFFTQGIHIGFQCRDPIRVRAKEWIVVHLLPNHPVDLDRAELGQNTHGSSPRPVLSDISWQPPRPPPA